MTRGMLGRLMVLGALAAGVWGWSGAVEAQRPLYGSANLRAGFMPDPHIMTGQMGGTIQASQFAQTCRGTVNPQPSHIVRTQTGFRNIRFVVNGQGDSTLMVMLPNGQVICDDDGGEGLNPLIQTSSPPGDIRIWVGVYSQSNQGRPYTIGVTELSHISASNLNAPPGPMPGPVPGPAPVSGISPNSPPTFGGVNLRAGFMPDPHVVAGTAGGPVSAQAVDQSCRGYVSAQPSHILVSQTGFGQIRIAVNGGSLDTTLLVMLPNGQVVCNDDSEGFNPMVSFSTGPGTVRVWVGTYSQGRSGPYNIGFSELSHVGPSTLPAPGGVVVAPPRPGPGPVPPRPPTPAGEVVQLSVGQQVTLLGYGVEGTVALWRPTGGPPTQVSLSGRTIMAGGVSVATLPPSMRDPVVTVTQQRAGTMVVRAEQPPMGRGDRGEAIVLLVGWQGRPMIQERWNGRYGARAPRWAR